ncbi:MAG: hypothetical protein HQK66_09000, partial [Desulfamplus sp.]|nr:hypothetical protein [Desulfamplus sp.]
MKTTKIMISEQDREKFNGDLLVYFMAEKQKPRGMDPFTEARVKSVMDCGDFKGKAGETIVFHTDANDALCTLSVPRILVAGVGDVLPEGETGTSQVPDSGALDSGTQDSQLMDSRGKDSEAPDSGLQDSEVPASGALAPGVLASEATSG